jgi:hypothetical protein
MSRHSRSVRRLATALAGGAVLGATALAGPASAAPGCPTGWGSLPEAAHATGGGTVEGVRSGEHACFDRVVIDLAGVEGVTYDVRYVSSVTADGSGAAVPLRGAADLRIVVEAPAHDDRGRATYAPANRAEVVPVGGYDTLRQVAWAGSFEGTTTLGVGVRARLPFRAFVLDDGSGARLVVDVAHTW